MRIIYIGGPLDGVTELRECLPRRRGIVLSGHARRVQGRKLYHHYRFERPANSACVLAVYVKTLARLKGPRGGLRLVRARKDGNLWPVDC